MNQQTPVPDISIGVGLRHQHIVDALDTPAPIDFVEIHSENYFASGGALHHLVEDIAKTYAISLHSTALGLGSAHGIPTAHLNHLKTLVEIAQPMLMSDHAAFAWGKVGNHPVHAGDLLPLVYNTSNLNVMVQHVDHIQQMMGRQLLVENLSAYITLPDSIMSEQEFLVRLSEATGCGLLIDLNNILVNAVNGNQEDILSVGKKWLATIPKDSVGEFHLAGYTSPVNGEMAVDDHARPVTELCWELYAYAIQEFGAIPTLIEWDNQLPSWSRLLEEASEARAIANQALAIKGVNHA